MTRGEETADRARDRICRDRYGHRHCPEARLFCSSLFPGGYLDHAEVRRHWAGLAICKQLVEQMGVRSESRVFPVMQHLPVYGVADQTIGRGARDTTTEKFPLAAVVHCG